ncbi:MAG TPA: hypothetical protein VD962_12565 [Rubricoccaceae bacterium]|nr:hypothetical protein [Rubricoccaceae bacterium]
MLLPFLAVAAVLGSEAAAQGQAPLSDTLLTWRSYSAERSARVRLYPCEDERRPRTVVVDEPAGEREPVTDEVRYFAEVVGRTFGFDPAEASFVFRYTAASFTDGAGDDGKALLLRATFRRAESGDLGAPTWRLLTSDALEDLTDRALR